MKTLTSLFIFTLLLFGCAATPSDQNTQPNTLPDTLVQDPPAAPEPEPKEEKQLPNAAQYAVPLAEKHFIPLQNSRFLPEQPEELATVKTKLFTIDEIDYIEVRAVPTDAQWWTMLFNWSGAVHSGHPNTFDYPSALCVFEFKNKKFLAGFRYHTITVKMDLKFYSKETPDKVTVEGDADNLKVKPKDWEPENAKFWIQSEDKLLLLPHDGKISVHLTKRKIFVQTTGTRLDCRMAVIMTKRDEQGKIQVAGGVFTITIENGNLAFPD